MDFDLTTKWILGIVGTIFLGALGSGLWSLVFQPMSRITGKAIFNITTFGLKRFKNQLYIEASFGKKDYSVRMFFAVCLLAVMSAVTAIHAVDKNRTDRDFFIKNAFTSETSDKLTKEEIKAKVYAKYDKYLSESYNHNKNVTYATASVLLVIILLQFLSIFYVEQIISRFERRVQVCLPHFVGKEREDLQSAFALMRSEDDYKEIMQKLKEIAVRGGIKFVE